MIDVQLKADEGRVAVTVDGGLFVEYVYGHYICRPCFYPVLTPSGQALTRGLPLRRRGGREPGPLPPPQHLHRPRTGERPQPVGRGSPRPRPRLHAAPGGAAGQRRRGRGRHRRRGRLVRGGRAAAAGGGAIFPDQRRGAASHPRPAQRPVRPPRRRHLRRHQGGRAVLHPRADLHGRQGPGAHRELGGRRLRQRPGRGDDLGEASRLGRLLGAPWPTARSGATPS